MVIKGRSRGNGRQLGNYLLTKGENENIRILHVSGWDRLSEESLKQSLLSMSLSSELTKSDKGLYHAQINPAYGEDERMTDDDWLQAADILAKHLGLDNQRRVVVLHTKKQRTHAHVAFERYNFDTGKMIKEGLSKRKQDKAREEMEKTFEHLTTPRRNEHRPEMKVTLTRLWHKHGQAPEFLQHAFHHGYLVAAGSGRRKFVVVDREGISHDLVRQIDGTNTKDVRDRMRGQNLMQDKEAIAWVQHWKNFDQQQSNKAKAQDFAANRNQVLETENKAHDKTRNEKMQTYQDVKGQIAGNKHVPKQERFLQVAKGFAESRNDMLSDDEQRDFERQVFIERKQQETYGRQRQRGRGRS